MHSQIPQIIVFLSAVTMPLVLLAQVAGTSPAGSTASKAKSPSNTVGTPAATIELDILRTLRGLSQDEFPKDLERRLAKAGLPEEKESPLVMISSDGLVRMGPAFAEFPSDSDVWTRISTGIPPAATEVRYRHGIFQIEKGRLRISEGLEAKIGGVVYTHRGGKWIKTVY